MGVARRHDVYSERVGPALDAYIARTKNEEYAAWLLGALVLPKAEKGYPKGKRMTEYQVIQRLGEAQPSRAKKAKKSADFSDHLLFFV